MRVKPRPANLIFPTYPHHKKTTYTQECRRSHSIGGGEGGGGVSARAAARVAVDRAAARAVAQERRRGWRW